MDIVNNEYLKSKNITVVIVAVVMGSNYGNSSGNSWSSSYDGGISNTSSAGSMGLVQFVVVFTLLILFIPSGT